MSRRPAGGSAARRWLIAGAIGVVVIGALIAGLLVVYPYVGARVIRAKLTAKLGGKLGRDVRVRAIEVSLGHAVLHDLQIRGPHDGDTPLIHVDRIELEFDTLRSLVGSVRLGPAAIAGVIVTLRRDPAGHDNVRDVVERLRRDGATAATGSGDRSTRPTVITVSGIKLLADDGVTGATALVGDGTARWTPGELTAELRNVSATTLNAPRASAATLQITKHTGQPPKITIVGGELAVWPKLALSGIGGTVVSDPAHPGAYSLELAGGYGGVPGELWTAKGHLDPGAQTASVDLVAAKFQLDKLAPLLEQSAVVDYAETTVDTQLHLDVTSSGGTFAGALTLRGLNIGHPMLADKEVHDLDLSAQLAGSFDRATRTVALTRGDFVSREVPFSVTGSASQRDAVGAPTTVVEDDDKDGKDGKDTPVARRGPGGLATLKLHLVVPPIDCQKFLDAIPGEMAPYMQGYKLRGTFATDIETAIDWDDLDATTLGGSVGIRRCRVTDEPADSPKRLLTEFEHYVELAEGEWISFVVGPSNEDFVPLDQISPYLIKSIMTTEDSAFYQHHGFIVSEFRTALVNNLKAGKFKHGASSITMQFVKNVLLYREKTLLRKLQELFLTWHVENTLTKDRILEIYFNVIEYGPGLYGIGPASWHYFSKPARDLNPVEAAFFSSILPAPKDRYKQYCQGTLTRWTTSKIQRILGIMLKRKRLTEVEYEQAMATPLLFAKDDSETEADCLKRVKKAIKNARPTNPMKR